MSIGQTLRDLLAPLGVYRWEGSFQWGELQSEGAALDQAEETLARISTGSGSEEALRVMEIYPSFQGALVVCDGGNSASVRLAVTKSVAALTGLSTEKISVCGRK